MRPCIIRLGSRLKKIDARIYFFQNYNEQRTFGTIQIWPMYRCIQIPARNEHEPTHHFPVRAAVLLQQHIHGRVG